MSGPRSDTATLYLKVTDSAGVIPQGNVFVVLTNDRTQQVWRTLYWHRATQSFLFARLPLGGYSYRAWRSPDDEIRGQVDLSEPRPRHASVRFAVPLPRQRLHVPIGGRLAGWRRRIAEADPHGSAGGVSRPAGGAGSVLGELLADGRAVAAATQPIAALGVPADLWSFLNAQVPPPQPGGSPSDAAVARARFIMITLCVATNARLRSLLAPEASTDDVWQTVLRVMTTLDTPVLDELLIWAAWMHHPQSAVLEMFARAWAERFDGLCNLRPYYRTSERRDPPDLAVKPPAMPRLPAAVADESRRRASAPLLAEVARIIDDCTKGRPR